MWGNALGWTISAILLALMISGAAMLHRAAEISPPFLMQKGKCRIDIVSGNEFERRIAKAGAGIVVIQGRPQGPQPIVDERDVQKAFPEGQTLDMCIAAIDIFVMRQIFFVATYQIKRGGKDVEGEVAIRSIEYLAAVDFDTANDLWRDPRFKKQPGGNDGKDVFDGFGGIVDPGSIEGK